MSLKRLFELIFIRKTLRKRKRNSYIRPIFANRVKRGEMFLVEELANDEYYHQKYFRMTKENFEFLLEKLKPRLSHAQTHRFPISPKMRLAITLRYLATGSSQITLALSFRISPSSVGKLLRETLAAIWEILKDDFMKSPKNSDDWERIANDYDLKWNFPHCCGTMDGKHIRFKSFANTGSFNFNYKKFFSLVLFISADADYNISYLNVGAPGSQSDSAILEESKFGEELYNNTLPLPKPAPINNSNEHFTFVFLGDGGFQLRKNLLVPYAIHSTMSIEEKIFNYRLSRARRISENVFGILVARWRIFKTEIEADRELAMLIMKATTVLHNFLMSKRDLINLTLDEISENGEVVSSGNWREFTNQDTGYKKIKSSNNYSKEAKEIRDNFATFFLTPQGSVPWQINQATKGYDLNSM